KQCLAAAPLALLCSCIDAQHVEHDGGAKRQAPLMRLPSPGLALPTPHWKRSVEPPRTRSVGVHRALVGAWEVDDRRGVVGRGMAGSTSRLLGLDDEDTLYGADAQRVLYWTGVGERDGGSVVCPGAHATPVPGDDVRDAVVAGAVVAMPIGGAVVVSRDR